MADYTFRMGELFSGPGGMARGAHDAAARVAGVQLVHSWANDYDADTCSTYKHNIPGATDETVHQGNVKDLDIEALPPIDGLAFGFPCNDYSLVGEWKGLDGDFGPLYSYGVRVLDSHRPQWFVAENVSGLQRANEGRALRKVLDELARAGGTGYKLYPHVYSFDQYGVPQRRRRIIIVGIRKDLDVDFRVPSPEIYANLDVTAGTALTSPPIDGSMPNHEFTRQAPQVVARLSHIRPGENAFNANLPEELRLNVKGATISQIYRKLRRDEPSYTVTGSGGGGTHVYHWDEPRALTNRERARLQSFPDDFLFRGSKESVRKQVGMAVPVRGAEAVFTALFKSFVGASYPSIEPSLSELVS